MKEVLIKAHLAPEKGIEERAMIRCETRGGVVVWVHPDEIIVPDRCDGNQEG